VRVFSFPAIIGTGARVLILGSMPGVASLGASQYYAHARNQFWPLMGELCGATPDLPYAQRLQVLLDHHIALWDVLHSCVRPGSLDASIEHTSAQPNDLVHLLRQADTIGRICCNGGTAHLALKRHFEVPLAQDFPRLQVLRLPSTSPANASWSYARKLNAWRSALNIALDIAPAP
jgi:TDG/mug DNA glycosylase family protein